MLETSETGLLAGQLCTHARTSSILWQVEPRGDEGGTAAPGLFYQQSYPNQRHCPFIKSPAADSQWTLLGQMPVPNRQRDLTHCPSLDHTQVWEGQTRSNLMD